MEVTMTFLAAVKAAYRALDEGPHPVISTIKELLGELPEFEREIIWVELSDSDRVLKDGFTPVEMLGKTLNELVVGLLIPRFLEELIMEDPEVDALEAKRLLS